MATSGDGFVAVGSDDGKLRLYSNKSLKKAQTAIPSLGAAITAVDVTYDGRWVVATTPDYLLVVNTIFTTTGERGDGKGARFAVFFRPGLSSWGSARGSTA